MKKLKWILMLLVVSLALCSVSFAADSKLSALTALAEAPAADDEVYINDGGTSKKITTLNFMKLLEGSLASYAIHEDNLPATYLTATDIDTSPVESESAAPISSGWAYDHTNTADQHPEYMLDHQAFTAFSASDATPNVGVLNQYFQTADTTTITDFDDGGDSSTLSDGQLVEVLCLHAGAFDFTSSGLTSPYAADHTMIVGSVEVFQYDLDNATWRWVTPKSPTATPSGESDGFLVVTGPGTAANRLISGTANEVTVDDPDGSEGNVTIGLAAALDLGGKVLEIPNGTSGTTDADGETYLDTDGDGGTNFSGPVVQMDAGASAGYLFPIALPLAASQDNYIPKYDASSKTISWEADVSAGTTAWDDIADPDADATIAFAGYEQIITSTLDEASHSVLTITNTDADRANATTILNLKDYDTGDAQATYLNCEADSDGTPASVFSINQSTGINSTLSYNSPTLVTPVIGVATGTSLALTGNITGLTPAINLGTGVCEGTQDGGDDQDHLDDADAGLTADALIGMTVYNTTDGSSGLITDNTATSIIATLAGGTENDWDDGDAWTISPGPSQSGSIIYIGVATTIRHPATAGYSAIYYSTVAGVVKVDPADAMRLWLNGTDIGADGDELDSAGAAGDFIAIHNVSATVGRTLGRSGTWVDGGAS